MLSVEGLQLFLISENRFPVKEREEPQSSAKGAMPAWLRPYLFYPMASAIPTIMEITNFKATFGAVGLCPFTIWWNQVGEINSKINFCHPKTEIPRWTE